MVRTPGFHPDNKSSILLRGTKIQGIALTSLTLNCNKRRFNARNRYSLNTDETLSEVLVPQFVSSRCRFPSLHLPIQLRVSTLCLLSVLGFRRNTPRLQTINADYLPDKQLAKVGVALLR